VKVVANTTPIISLASIGRLDLLEHLFGRVLIAEAVYRELKAKPSYGYAQVDCPFIEVRPIQGLLTNRCCSINSMPVKRKPSSWLRRSTPTSSSSTKISAIVSPPAWD
jgi:hypothetical protein